MEYQFEVEVSRNKANDIFDIMKLFHVLHSNDKCGYFFKKDGNCNQKDWLLLNTKLLGSDENVYPLDVILPLIKYRMLSLPKSDTSEYDSFDDVNFEQTFTTSITQHGIEIRPTFITIGK